MGAGSILAYPIIDTSLGERPELGTEHYDGPYGFSPDLDDPEADVHVPGAFAAYESPLGEERRGGRSHARANVHRHARVVSGDGGGYFGRHEHRRDDHDFIGVADDDGNDDSRSETGSTSSSSELSMHSALEDFEDPEGVEWEIAQPVVRSAHAHGAYIHSPTPVRPHGYAHENTEDEHAHHAGIFGPDKLVNARDLHNTIVQHHSPSHPHPQPSPHRVYATEAARRAALEPYGKVDVDVVIPEELQAQAENAEADLRTAVDRMLLDQAQREQGQPGRAKVPMDVDADAVAGARAVLGKLGLEEANSSPGAVATSRNASLSRKDASADTRRDERQDKESRKWIWPFSGKEKTRSKSRDAARMPQPKLRSKSQRRSESDKLPESNNHTHSHLRSQSVALPRTIESTPAPRTPASPTPPPPHVHLYRTQPWLRGGITRSDDPLENISSVYPTLADSPVTAFERTYEHAAASAGMRAARDAARAGCPGWDWALAGEDDDGNVWASENSGAQKVRDAWIKKEREKEIRGDGQEASMNADVDLDSEVTRYVHAIQRGRGNEQDRAEARGFHRRDNDVADTDIVGNDASTGHHVALDLRTEEGQPQGWMESAVPPDRTTSKITVHRDDSPSPAPVRTLRRTSMSPWRGFKSSRRSSSSNPPDAGAPPLVPEQVQAHRMWVWGRRGSLPTSSITVGGAGARGSIVSLPVGSTAASGPHSHPENTNANAEPGHSIAASDATPPAAAVAGDSHTETVTTKETSADARERSRSRGRVHARTSNAQGAGGARRRATLVKSPPGERGRVPVRANSTPATGAAVLPVVATGSKKENGQSEHVQPVERHKSTKAKEERARQRESARKEKEENDRIARELKEKEQREKGERERLDRETKEREALEAKERERVAREHEREEKERLKAEAKLAKEVRERERKEAKEREAREKLRAKEEAKANVKVKEKAKTKEQSKTKLKTTVRPSVEDATVPVVAAATAASVKAVSTPEAQDLHARTEPEFAAIPTPIQNKSITTTYASVASEDRNKEAPSAAVNVSDLSAQIQTQDGTTALASELALAPRETRSKEGGPHKPTPAPPHGPPTKPQPSPPPKPTPGRRSTHQRRASEPLKTYELASVPPPPVQQPPSAPAAPHHSRSRSQAAQSTIAGTSTATITQKAEYSHAFTGNADAVGVDPPFLPNDPPQNWVSLYIMNKLQPQVTSRLRMSSLFRAAPEPETHRKLYTIDPSMEYKAGLMDVFDRLRATPGSSSSAGAGSGDAGGASVVAGLFPGMRPAGAAGSGIGKKNLTLEVEGGGMDVDVYVLPWVPKQKEKGRNHSSAAASRRSTLRRASTTAASTFEPAPSLPVPTSAPTTANATQTHPGGRRAQSEDGGVRPLLPYQNHANEIRPDHRSWGLGLAGGNIGIVDGRRTTFERSGMSEESWVRAGNPPPVLLSTSAPPPATSGTIPRTRAVSVDRAAYTPSSPLARGGTVYADDEPDEKEVQDELDAPPRLLDDSTASVSDVTAVDAPPASPEKEAVIEIELRLKEARMGRGRKGDKGGTIKDSPEAGLVARIHAPFPRPPVRLLVATVDSIPFTPPAQPSTGHPPPAPGAAPIARPPRRPVDVPHTRTRSRAPLTLALPRTFVGPVIVHVGDGYVRDDGASGVGAQISISRGLQAYGASVQIERGYMRGYNIGPTEKLVARSSAAAALKPTQPRPRPRRRILRHGGTDTTQSDTDDAERTSTSDVDADASTDEFELVDSDEVDERVQLPPMDAKGWTGDCADIYVACGPVRLQLIGEDENEAWGTPTQRWYWPWGR